MDVLIPLAFMAVLLVIGFVVGGSLEAAHFKDIRRREHELLDVIATTLEEAPESWRALDAQLVTGNVVISLDYFKRFLAALRGFAGGNVSGYETLLDRGRREALLRMRERARAAGYDGVLNVRLETSRLASSQQDGKGTAGIEILAFGTAVKR